MPRKSKYQVFGLAALVAAGGLWFGRLAWRAHHYLVTLDVREAPLAEVLRDIDQQTWTKIREEARLDSARITLHVKNAPLAEVLSRIAEQAGAHWSTLYAVYDSSRSLRALERALHADGNLEAAGWTKLAPKPASLDKPVRWPGPETSGPLGGRQGMMMTRSKGGPIVMRVRGPNGQVETWSPQQLVAESALASRIGADDSLVAGATGAAQIARRVNGRWTTYLAFSKSSMGVGFRIPPPPPGGTQPAFRQMRLPDPNERFANLTPEQRVERARQRQSLHVESGGGAP